MKSNEFLNQRPIPEAALRDENAVEMLRVWVAEQRLHCSMKVGMYRETTQFPEEEAWGTILADVAMHLANAMERQYQTPPVQTLAGLRAAFLREIDKPSGNAQGDFTDRH